MAQPKPLCAPPNPARRSATPAATQCFRAHREMRNPVPGLENFPTIFMHTAEHGFYVQIFIRGYFFETSAVISFPEEPAPAPEGALFPPWEPP